MVEQIELGVTCYSEKVDASLWFGFCISEDDVESARVSEEFNLYEGICDSYWELWSDFEPGILKAKKMVDEGRFEGAREALFEVFGHFLLQFEINGVHRDFEYELDVDEVMYSLLEGTYSSE